MTHMLMQRREVLASEKLGQGEENFTVNREHGEGSDFSLEWILLQKKIKLQGLYRTFFYLLKDNFDF